MITEHDIVALIEGLADATGWKLSYAARMAAGSGDAVDRFNAGGGLTLRRANTIIHRCSEHWPADKADQWPEQIARPTKKEAA